jgi:hypothetical protein
VDLQGSVVDEPVLPLEKVEEECRKREEGDEEGVVGLLERLVGEGVAVEEEEGDRVEIRRNLLLNSWMLKWILTF